MPWIRIHFVGSLFLCFGLCASLAVSAPSVSIVDSGIAGTADRRAVDRALAGTGLEPLLAAEPRVRVAKRGFQLVYTAA